MNVDARIGSQVAAYRLERVLGRGGMGVVYLAEDARLGRHVALKLLSPELVGDARFRERFVRESRLAAALEHPNIIPIHAAGEENGLLFLAMRYIDGTDLRALVGEHGPLGVERTVGIISGVAAALDAAHAQGLVHRDVKPSNVLLRKLGGQDHAYLADFGLTKPTSSMTGLTGTGQLVGTIDYLAPEVIEGRPADPRADQYALGCVLYECLVGRPPFARETEAATLWAHMRDKPPPTGVAAADAVLARALAKAPDARYPTCGEMVADLQRRLPKPAESSAMTRRAKLLVGAGAMVALGATAAVTAALSGTAAAAFKPAPPDSVVAIDTATGKIVGRPVRAGRAPTQIVVSGANVWVANAAGRSLTWIDARTRTLVRTIPLGATPTGVAAGANGAVWVDEGLARRVLEILPRPGGPTDVVYPRVPVCCPGPGQIAVSAGRVFVGSAEGIFQLSASRTAWRRITSAPAAGSAVTAADGSVYFSNGWDAILHVLQGGDVSTLRATGAPSGLAWTAENLWYALPNAGSVAWVSPYTYAGSSSLTVPGEPIGAAADGRSVWIAGAESGVISRINLATQKVTATTRVGGRPTALTTSRGVVWVAVDSTSALAEASGTLFTSTGNDMSAGPADGRGPRQVVGTNLFGMPDFSPDGRQITFAGNGPPQSASGTTGTWLARVRPDNRIVQRRPITSPRFSPGEFGPSWSPDGKWIAVWDIHRDHLPHGVKSASHVLVANPDGSHVRVVRTRPAVFLDLAQLDWSPDGRRLVVQDPNPNAYTGLLQIINPATGVASRLTLWQAFSPRWSPDGTRVAYLSDYDGPGIYVSSVDDASPHKLSSIPLVNGTIAWSPDGRELAYAGYGKGAGDGVHIIYADGNGNTHLSGTTGDDSFPAWRPYP